MGLADSPSFFQHRMESLFAGVLWKLVLIYVDDVIVFGESLESHPEHLNKVLCTLETSGVTINIAKCHFGSPSIQALGHQVSRLGLITLEEETDAIRELLFPKTLGQVERYIDKKEA